MARKFLGWTFTKANADLDSLKAGLEADASTKAGAAQAAATAHSDAALSAARTTLDASITAEVTNRAAGDAALDARIATVEAGQAAGSLGYATKAAMDADLAHGDGTIAIVTNDPTPNNNTTYRKSGASGAGSWVASSSDRVAKVEAVARRWPFADSAAHTANQTTQNDTFRGIIDVWLAGTAPAYDVAVERIYRNYEATPGNHFWYISIKRTDTLAEVARINYINSNPEPADPDDIAEYDLTFPTGLPGAGKILVRWSAITAAASPAASGAFGMLLDRGVWRPTENVPDDTGPSLIARNLRDRVATLEASTDPSNVRRGMVGVGNSHPFLRGATLSLTAVLDGQSRDTLLAMIERSVVDIVLYGTDPAETYRLERIRRNGAAGQWVITVSRQSDGVTCAQFLTTTNPEPADPKFVSRHDLIAVNPNAYSVTGRVWVRWGEMTVGVNDSLLALTLASTVKAPLGGASAHGSTIVPSMNELVTTRGMQYVILPDTGWTDGFTLAADGTLSWDQFVVVDPFGHSSGRVRISAGSIVLNTAYQVAWVDVEAARSVATAPASMVKVGTWFGGTADDFKGLPHQLPIAAQAADGRRYLLPAALAVAGIDVPEVVTPSAYQTDEVFVSVVANTSVDVYMKPSGEAVTKYTRYRLERYTAADADVWTIMGVWEATRTADAAFTTGKRIVVEGSEMLCAMQESGKADFMGGRAHGDETMEASPVLWVDGKEVSLAATATYRAREVAFLQFTSLWEATVLPHVNRRAYRRLWLTFTNGEMRARQRLEWQAAITVAAGYCAMLPLHRYETFVSGASENPASAQISGKYTNDKEFTVENCAAFDGSAISWRSGIRRWRGWGTYGVSGEVELLACTGPLDGYGGIQKSSYVYNKAYIGALTQPVVAGDVWTAETRWRITSAS